MIDDDPTPTAWYAYPAIAAECARIADRLRRVALASRKRVDLYDLARARRCDEIVQELERVSTVVAGWDDADPERMVLERNETMPRVVRALGRADDELSRLPTDALLGPVRGS